METQDQNSIIHRKAQGARDEFDARVMSPAKALRLGLAKSADALFDMVVTITTVEQSHLAQSAVEGEMGSDGLLMLLDGNDGICGALKFDMQFLAALIEVQTTGVVTPSEAAARSVTRTDAAMAAPLVDMLLEAYDSQLAEMGPEPVSTGYRFGDLVEDGRALSLILNTPEYDMFRLSVDIAEGAKSGVLTLILPMRPSAPADKKAEKAKAGCQGELEGNVLEASVVLDSIVARLNMPLKEICGLAPGALIPIPTESLAKTQLVAIGNQVVAEVVLGQVNGLRAVRFAAQKEMVEPVSDMPQHPAMRAGAAMDAPLATDNKEAVWNTLGEEMQAPPQVETPQGAPESQSSDDRAPSTPDHPMPDELDTLGMLHEEA